MSYSVAVRALCEFTAKVGDLDLRFTPSPSAQEGIVGHRTIEIKDVAPQATIVISHRSEIFANDKRLTSKTLTPHGEEARQRRLEP